MKFLNIIVLTTTGILSFFAPIATTICALMGFILVDTLTRLISIYFITKRKNRKFEDVFDSKTLRVKFILKSLGYMVLALSVSVIDIKVITPTIKWFLENFYSNITIPTQALASNVLIIIFCFMELSSINENWNMIAKIDLFKSVSKIVVKTRDFIIDVIGFFKSIKSDVYNFKSDYKEDEEKH